MSLKIKIVTRKKSFNQPNGVAKTTISQAYCKAILLII